MQLILDINFVSCYCAEFIYQFSEFCGGIFEILYVQYLVICEWWQFYFFLFSLDAFYFSSCLIAVARTSSTILNKRGESRYSCIIPDLKGNAYSFCPLNLMLAVGLSFMFRYVPPNATLLRVFIITGCWILSSTFSVPIDIIMWFLFCLCGESCLLIWEHCTKLTFLEKIPHDHGVWSWCIAVFNLLIFCWGF